MSRAGKSLDSNQLEIPFTWEKQIEQFVEVRKEIQIEAEEIAKGPEPQKRVECEFELSVTIAAAIKRALDDSGLSREQLVDEINAYFGRTKAGAVEQPPEDEDGEPIPPVCRRPLTIHMLNNYLSKPADCPIPAYYLFAIHHITRSLAPAEEFVKAEGGKVATGVEIRQMQIGKLQANLEEGRMIMKELKKHITVKR
ncbi:MAG: hypothetical protein ABIK15_07125 [Pseudomonadota bacterium]